MATRGIAAERADRLKRDSLMLQRDFQGQSISSDKDEMTRDTLTVQKESGRKKMLTQVSSLIFSPNLVDERLSMTALALKSCTHYVLANVPTVPNSATGDILRPAKQWPLLSSD